MSNIREYEKKKEINKGINFNKKIVQHRLRIFFKIFLGMLVLGGVGFVLSVQMTNRVYTDYQVISSSVRSKVENTVSRNYNGNILTYSNDGANCSDVKGTVLWNQTFEMQNPLIDINGDVVAIADYNGRKIYVMNSTGILGEIETGMPIRKFKVSEDGIVAAVLDDSKINAIYLYATNGDTIAYFKTTMKNSGYPVTLSISDNSKIVAISYLHTDSGMITSNVAFYNFGEVGQNEGDNYVSGYSYQDAIVPELGFMNNTTSFAVADNRLVIYKGKEIPKSEAEVMLQQEITSVYYDEKYIGLVFVNTNGESKYKIDVYNDMGKLIHTQGFNLDYSEIYFSNDCIIIYNDTECAIYSLKGKEKFNGTFNTSVAALLPTNKIYKYIAVTPDKIETIELK